jgi:hypothetical protein
MGFQTFRLPLELVLHSWSTQGSIPTSMTFDGSNFDIVTGFASVFSALMIKRLGEGHFAARLSAWTFGLLGFGMFILRC